MTVPQRAFRVLFFDRLRTLLREMRTQFKSKTNLFAILLTPFILELAALHLASHLEEQV